MSLEWRGKATLPPEGGSSVWWDADTAPIAQDAFFEAGEPPATPGVVLGSTSCSVARLHLLPAVVALNLLSSTLSPTGDSVRGPLQQAEKRKGEVHVIVPPNTLATTLSTVIAEPLPIGQQWIRSAPPVKRILPDTSKSTGPTLRDVVFINYEWRAPLVQQAKRQRLFHADTSQWPGPALLGDAPPPPPGSPEEPRAPLFSLAKTKPPVFDTSVGTNLVTLAQLGDLPSEQMLRDAPVRRYGGWPGPDTSSGIPHVLLDLPADPGAPIVPNLWPWSPVRIHSVTDTTRGTPKAFLEEPTQDEQSPVSILMPAPRRIEYNTGGSYAVPKTLLEEPVVGDPIIPFAEPRLPRVWRTADTSQGSLVALLDSTPVIPPPPPPPPPPAGGGGGGIMSKGKVWIIDKTGPRKEPVEKSLKEEVEEAFEDINPPPAVTIGTLASTEEAEKKLEQIPVAMESGVELGGDQDENELSELLDLIDFIEKKKKPKA